MLILLMKKWEYSGQVGQYHGKWCPGSLHHHIISSHDNDFVGYLVPSWWRHQMETFSVLLAISAGNSPVPGEFPAQRPMTRSFHVFFDLRPNKPLSKQSWGWWFEMLLRPLWCLCNMSLTRKDFSSMPCFSVWKWWKMQMYDLCFLK